MLPSRNYQPSYPPPRNIHGQQQQQQMTNQGNIYQQGPGSGLPTYDLRALNQPPTQQQQQPQAQPQQPLPSAQADANGAGGGGGEMNLASVLHYLQSEWRRWERDRNEWEIERAEMRARIALLEGQRRSAENLKVDLLRRVKMLEFALRQERTKSVGTAGRASGIAPSKLATLQEDDRSSNNEKEGSDSGGSGASDRDDGERKTNGHAGSSKMSVMSKSSSDSNHGMNTWKSVGAVPRDPKSRARSREYLKQCLQEVTYLTSPGALNPLPPRPLLDEPDQQDPSSTSEPIHEPERPTKALPTRAIPSMFEREKPKEESLPNGTTGSSPAPDVPSKTHLTAVTENSDYKPPSSPLVYTKSLPDEEGEMGYPEQSKQLLTAIYRPESKSAWRQELQTANERAEQAQKERGHGKDGSFSQITLEDEDVTDGSTKLWKQRVALKGHLDVVRSVAIVRGQGVYLVTGGDDNTVKLWNVEISRISSARPRSREPTKENETLMTYRGHTAAITSVAASTELKQVFSGSLDSTIRVWRLLPPDHDPYSTYDPSLSIQKLVGHTEAIWDLCLLPNQATGPSTHRLASASADGTVKIWTSEGGKAWSLTASVGEFDGVPTCLGVYHENYNQILIGTSGGEVILYDVEKQAKKVVLHSVESRVNAVLSHPTMPIIVAAYQDGNLRTFDLPPTAMTGPTYVRVKDTFFAHPSPITSLTLSPSSPTGIISASSTCNIRVWDLVKGVSVQDIESHRVKGGEGIVALASGEGNVVASAGADGMVRLWAC